MPLATFRIQQSPIIHRFLSTISFRLTSVFKSFIVFNFYFCNANETRQLCRELCDNLAAKRRCGNGLSDNSVSRTPICTQYMFFKICLPSDSRIFELSFFAPFQSFNIEQTSPLYRSARRIYLKKSPGTGTETRRIPRMTDRRIRLFLIQ